MYHNIIIVSGSGQNVGKTTFVCRLLEHFKSQNPAALKISPYWHNINSSDDIIIKNEKYLILKESNNDGNKDSSRMLLSGAKDTFYIQAIDKYIAQAFNYLYKIHLSQRAVVCESAALLNFIKPAVHFYISGENVGDITDKEFSKINGIIIHYKNKKSFNFDFNRLQLINNKWKLSQ